MPDHLDASPLRRALDFRDCSIVVVAAGSGLRFGGSKQLAPLGGMPMLARTLNGFHGLGFLEFIAVLPESFLSDGTWEREVAPHLKGPWLAVPGGPTRAESVRLGTARCTGTFVAIHDGARPFPPLRAASDALAKLIADEDLGAVIVAAPVTDTIKRIRPATEYIACTEDRAALVRAETPQLCRRKVLAAALQAPDARTARDDAEAIERAGHATAAVLHSAVNLKVTTPADLEVAEAMLRARL
jgi:2-C-methyl-D-erythritol 4-phosphate cytidylyltransferase